MIARIRREQAALRRAVALAGGQSALAAALGGNYKQQNVHSWLARQRIPLGACPGVEYIVGGRVKVEQLRGDVRWVRDAKGRPFKYEVHVPVR